MDLMSLLARLTLDKTDYDKGLKDAEQDAKNLTLPAPQIPKPDNTQFKTGLDEAEETGNLWKEVMVGVWNGVKDAIVVTGITSAVLAVVGAMRQGIDMAVETGDAVKKGAANLELSTKAYQEYEYTLGKSGLKMKDLTTVYKNMNKIMAGDDLKDNAGYLEELGINAEKAASKEELLADIMTSLSKYSGDDKGRIIDWLFGSNENWDGYFSKTSDEIDKLKKDAEDMGLIMSDDAINNAVEFKNTTDEISERIESIKRSFGEGVLPVLTDIAKTFKEIIVFFSGGDKSIAEMLAGDDKELANQLTTIEGTSAAANTLADKLLQMGDTSKMTKEQYAIWKGTAEELIKLVPSLSDVINTETGEINTNSEGIKENIRQWQELAKQKAIQATKEKKMQEVTEKNNDLIEKSIEANKLAADADSERVQAIIGNNGNINDLLKSHGLETISENATSEDVRAARQRLYQTAGSDAELQQIMDEWNAVAGDWEKADKKARDAEKSAADLQKQLDDAMKEYDDWVAAIDRLYGVTGTDAATATEQANALQAAIDSIPDYKRITIKEERLRPFAIGSSYIPYDMPALLHRGERILTATENRKGAGSAPDYSAMEDVLVSAINRGMANATVRSYLNGRDITAEVNRQNINDVKGRRFAP